MKLYEVYGLQDWEPFALACKPCADLVLGRVVGAHASLAADAPGECDCELNYEGICEEEGRG